MQQRRGDRPRFSSSPLSTGSCPAAGPAAAPPSDSTCRASRFGGQLACLVASPTRLDQLPNREYLGRGLSAAPSRRTAARARSAARRAPSNRNRDRARGWHPETAAPPCFSRPLDHREHRRRVAAPSIQARSAGADRRLRTERRGPLPLAHAPLDLVPLDLLRRRARQRLEPDVVAEHALVRRQPGREALPSRSA